MEGCELCSCPAMIYCESDGASLCWDCDAKVHSANFLVAKHSRCLLCHVCQSPTPWIATGTDLGRTVSVCIACAADNRHKSHDAVLRLPPSRPEIDDDQDELLVTDPGGEYSDCESECECDGEDGENQVVPWSCSPSPPCTSTFSSSEEDTSDSSRDLRVSSSSVKRRTALMSNWENDSDCSSSSIFYGEDTDAMPAAAEEQEANSSYRSCHQEILTTVVDRRKKLW